MTTLPSNVVRVGPSTELNDGLKDEQNESNQKLTLLGATSKARSKNGLQEFNKCTKQNSYKEIKTGGTNNHAIDKVKNIWSKILSSPSDKEEKKFVTFSENEYVRKIPPLSSMPPAAITDYWLSSEDIETMKWEAHFLLYFEERGEDDCIDYESDSTRGLEHATEIDSQKLVQTRRRACDVVLNEQMRQRKAAIDDPSIIAQLYKACSQQCVDMAMTMAKKDEDTVQEYLSENIPQKHF